LREALKQLGAMGITRSRRGSGIMVRPLRLWSFEALPAFLMAGAPGVSGGVVQVVSDLMSVRRTLILSILELAPPRLSVGDLRETRDLAVKAWMAQDDLPRFARLDIDALERNDGASAREIMGGYLCRHDAALMAQLGMS